MVLQTRGLWAKMMREARSSTPTAGIGAVIVALWVVVAVFGGAVAPYDPYNLDLANNLRPPSSDHWFGTDQLGRDLFSRVLVGARYSALIAISSVALGLIVGVPLGLSAGFFGGLLDALVMRWVDFQLALPRILVAILLSALFGIGLNTVIIAVGIASVPTFARLARAGALQVSQEDYVLAARAIGVPSTRLLARYILPNAAPPIILQSTFEMAFAMLLAGGLSFVGLGVRPPTPEWGSLLAEARNYMTESPHLVTYPGLSLAATVLGVNLLGDALRERLDPRTRGVRGGK